MQDAVDVLGHHDCTCTATAKRVLREHGVSFRHWLPDEAPDLYTTHGQVLPAVLIGGRLRFRGRIEPRLLRRLLTREMAKPSEKRTESSKNQLGIFAKYWQPGAVKTRLATALGPDAASQVALAMLRHLMDRLAATPGRRVLACWPPERQPDFQRLADDRFQVEPQSSGDLGQRMAAYFQAAFAAGAQRVVLIGSDQPQLAVHHIEAAFDLLEHHQAVFGPAADGGYYLIGLSRFLPWLFEEIPWSSDQVWALTQQRLADRQCSYGLLPLAFDIDEVADLMQLLGELRAAGPQLDSRGQQLLAELSQLVERSVPPQAAAPRP